MAVFGRVAGKVSLIEVRMQRDRMKGSGGKELVVCFFYRIKTSLTGILSSGNVVLQPGLQHNLFLPYESGHPSGRIPERQ